MDSPFFVKQTEAGNGSSSFSILLPRSPSTAEILQYYCIPDLSKNSLLAALKRTNPAVRSFAANKLAELKFADAQSAIEDALSAEPDLNTQAQIAGALWVLHDPKGVERLLSMCMDSSLPSDGVLTAIRTLEIIKSPTGHCAKNALATIQRERDNGMQSMLISTLPPIFRDVSAETAAQIAELLKSFLADASQPFIVRESSSRALAQARVPGAEEAIQSAIERETDTTLKSGFEINLKMLQKVPFTPVTDKQLVNQGDHRNP